MMVGRLTFLFGMVYFQGRAVSLRTSREYVDFPTVFFFFLGGMPAGDHVFLTPRLLLRFLKFSGNISCKASYL